jgi:hypothetical protein
VTRRRARECRFGIECVERGDDDDDDDANRIERDAGAREGATSMRGDTAREWF